MSLKAIIRQNDPSDHGGYMISAGGKPVVNGLKLCVDGDIHVCPIKDHGNTPVRSTTRYTTGGKGVLRAGDVAGCGAVLISGSPTVTMG